MTDQKHNSICEGGKLHGQPFQYSGQSESHGYNNGRYVKTHRINDADLVIWMWEPNQETK